MVAPKRIWTLIEFMWPKVGTQRFKTAEYFNGSQCCLEYKTSPNQMKFKANLIENMNMAFRC